MQEEYQRIQKAAQIPSKRTIRQPDEGQFFHRQGEGLKRILQAVDPLHIKPKQQLAHFLDQIATMWPLPIM